MWFLCPDRFTPEIRDAIKSFNGSWLPRHGSECDFILYHYTEPKGITGILRNRAMWLTHTSALNDPSELNYGKEVISNELDEARDLEKNSIIRNLLYLLSKNLNRFDTILYEVYITCFCLDPNLVSQWRCYSNQGCGYNIGLKFDSNTKLYHTISKSDSHSHLVLRRVVYEPNEQQSLVRDYMKRVVQAVNKAKDKFRSQEEIDNWLPMAAQEASNVLFDLILSFKNQAFEEEEECRLIMAMRADHRPEQLRFRERNGALVPYLQMHIVDETADGLTFPLHSVTFGPKLNTETTKRTLNLLLRSEAASGHKVRISGNTVKVNDPGYVTG